MTRGRELDIQSPRPSVGSCCRQTAVFQSPFSAFIAWQPFRATLEPLNSLDFHTAAKAKNATERTQAQSRKRRNKTPFHKRQGRWVFFSIFICNSKLLNKCIPNCLNQTIFLGAAHENHLTRKRGCMQA